MNRLTRFVGVSVAISFLGFGLGAQSGAIDLSRLHVANGLQVVNRGISHLVDGSRRGLLLSADSGEGIAYLTGVEFSSGTIECDIRGKDVPQQSFLGIAFHGVDDTTYESVYFRPFNFHGVDSTHRAHAVQYESVPGNGWQKLRTEHPGGYEQPVNPVPNPNEWFHIRIVVADTTISVFVAKASQPSLVVRPLSGRSRGRVGLWVGNGSGGAFANLSIRPN
jgi:hypothetical protein